MNILVVEDELPARERLLATISRVSGAATVVGVTGSVADTRKWLSTHALPDLMLLDVQLSDGLSFELFELGVLNIPVIFATAYDRFILEAFDANAIGYLLKPISDEALSKSLAGYLRLRTHFDLNATRAIAKLVEQQAQRRHRIVSRDGSGFALLPITDIAYFISLDKLVYAIDRAGTKHLVDTTLAELAADLDPQQHFRVNRQMIVALDAVTGYRTAGKGTVALQLRPRWQESVVVTQERAAALKAWLGS